VLRYSGKNDDDDCVSYQEDDSDLLPKSLDNDFELSELCRYQNNTHCNLNEETVMLQQQLESHSPAKVRLPSNTQVRQSRKNMLECIDYVVSNGDISHNPAVVEIWDELERVIQEKQVLVRNIVLSASTTKPLANGVVWPAFTSKKAKVTERYKGITG